MADPSDLADIPYLPRELIKLGTFDWPRSEARQTLGHLFEKIKGGLLSNTPENAVEAENLIPVFNERFKGSVEDLLATTLGELFDRTYLEWATSEGDVPQKRAFVHSPMNTNALSSWAKLHDLPVLDQSRRLAEFPDATCVVIPQIETYFSRHHKQLTPLFDLFSEIEDFQGKVLVGCNSWAWRYLKQFDDALLLFEQVHTIPAFDADALSAILQCGLSSTGNQSRLTSVSTGKSILDRDDDDALMDPYLKDLAGRSLGHPWVAIELFFHGTAEIQEKDTEDGKHPSDEDRIWVDLADGCALPTSGVDALLFALHALMIHGSRPVAELNGFLPNRAPNGVWTELVRTGFVELHDNKARYNLRSYPDIRSELGAAGFNLDEL